MRLTVPLGDEDAARLKERAFEAGIGSAAWVRGAIRAASDDQKIAEAIATKADQSTWGGRRLGAGRPRRTRLRGGGSQEDAGRGAPDPD
jgi:hypothetical protein